MKAVVIRIVDSVATPEEIEILQANLQKTIRRWCADNAGIYTRTTLEDVPDVEDRVVCGVEVGETGERCAQPFGHTDAHAA